MGIPHLAICNILNRRKFGVKLTALAYRARRRRKAIPPAQVWGRRKAGAVPRAPGGRKDARPRAFCRRHRDTHKSRA
jgi:hypothetical protein